MSESTTSAQCSDADWKLARKCGLFTATPGTNTWDAALGRFADAIRASLAQQPQDDAVANAQIGVSDEADFEHGTWTFRMPSGYRVSAGEYWIVPKVAAPPQAAPSASAQQADRAIGWTDDADANAALLMLDRLEVSGEDDARVDAIAATIRRLAAPAPSASPADQIGDAEPTA